MNEQEPKTFEADGTRPIKNTEMEVADTFEEDGTRPIAESPDFLTNNRPNRDSTIIIKEVIVKESNSLADGKNISGTVDKIDPETEDALNINEASPEANNALDADRVLEVDGKRPVDKSNVEVVDTLQIDGERPIVEGDKPNGMASQRAVVDTLDIDGERPITSSTLDTDKVLKVDGKRPVDNSDVEVVDHFEADGERPIMANKYEVVDTLDIDGERPITSSN